MKIPDIIAVDGTAASGKSTLAEKLAQHLHYLYFDTGVMYRAVTLAALDTLSSVEDEAAVDRLAEQIDIDVLPPTVPDGRKYDVRLNGVDVTWEIRKPLVDANVSQVSAYPGVRRAMTEQQRKVGQRGAVVMVGRDIGTVVFPEAPLKLYMDASVEERARRRYTEVVERGEPASYESILASMRRRDRINSTRALAPLKAADDAVVIQTDGMGVEEVFKFVIEILEKDPPERANHADVDIDVK